jgi:hypothetical protein
MWSVMEPVMHISDGIEVFAELFASRGEVYG